MEAANSPDTARAGGFMMPGNYRFSDGVMFKNVIRNEEICKAIIEKVIHRKSNRQHPKQS